MPIVTQHPERSLRPTSGGAALGTILGGAAVILAVTVGG